MFRLKGHKLLIGLILVLLLSIGLSVYSISSYQGNSASSSSGNAVQMDQGFQRGGGPVPQGDGNNSRQGALSQSNHSTPPTSDGSSDSFGGNHAGFDSGGGQRFGGVTSASSEYAKPLAIYTTAFFGLVAAAYYVTRRKKIHLQEHNRPLLIGALLGIGLFVRIAIAPWIPGHPFDINLFKNWAASAANNLTGFYTNGSSDYPPFYVYILYAVGKLTEISALSPYSTLLIKLPSILADVATSYLLFKAARKYVSFEAGFLIAAFYLFNPAIFINSTFWGQVDSFFTLLVVAAVYFLSQNRIGGSAVLLTAAVLMKPQGIVYLPVLFFALVKTKRIKPWLVAAGAALVTTMVVVLPFSFGQEPLWLYKLYAGTVNEYPYASVNAFNFFALLGANYKADTSALGMFSYHTWGMIFIVLLTLFSWWMYSRSRSAKFASVAALLQIAGVFTFSSSMHERYLFPAAALALLAYAYFKDTRLLWLTAGFSLTIFLNTYDIFYNSTSGGASYSFILVITSILNVVLCGFLAKVAWDYGFGKKSVVPK